MKNIRRKWYFICCFAILFFCILWGFTYIQSFPQSTILQNELYGDDTETHLKDFLLNSNGVLIADSDDPWITLSLEEPMPVMAIKIQASHVQDLNGNLHIFDTDTWVETFGKLKNGGNCYYLYKCRGLNSVQNLRLDLVEREGASCCIESVTINPVISVWFIGFIRAFLPAILLFSLFILLTNMLPKIRKAIPLMKYPKFWKISLGIPASLVAAYLILINLRISVNGTSLFGTGILLFMIFRWPSEKNDRRTNIWLAAFSIGLAVANNFGSHIHIRENPYPYIDCIDHSYVTAYGWQDIIGIPVVSIVFFKTITLLLSLIKKIGKVERKASVCEKTVLFQNRVIPYGWPMAAMLLGWLPWFVLYYPGFIFGDSVSTLRQAAEGAALSNQHPVLYTLFLKLCIQLGNLFGNLTLGCGIYSAIQMLFIAFALGKLIEWLSKHHFPLITSLFAIAWFTLSPFYGQLSISMWKDPIFGAAGVLFTVNALNLFEQYKEDKTGLRENYSLIAKILADAFLVCFSRNNGAYALLFAILGGFLILHTVKSPKKFLRKCLLLLSCVVIVFAIVTGPIYSALDIIPAEKSAGVAAVGLNQMAAVAASEDGIMSEKDKDFMDQLLPLELYGETYTPCSVDNLKNCDQFDNDFLNAHMEEFVWTYLSIGIKNPVKYINAWALMTFGYWVPNYWEFLNDGENLIKGNLGDLQQSGLDIKAVYSDWTKNYWDFLEDVENLIKGNLGDLQQSALEIKAEYSNIIPDMPLYQIFRPYGSTLSLGIVNWILLFVVVLSIIKRDKQSLFAVLLSFGAALTMVFASPYWYWPRYGTMQLYLLPLYIYLILHLIRKPELNKIECCDNFLAAQTEGQCNEI